MKKLMMMIAACSIVAFSFAQVSKPAKGKPEMKAKKHTEWMKKELNLSPEQETKIYDINLSTITKAKAIKNDASLDSASRKAKLKEIHKARLVEYKKVLNADQLALLKQKAKEHRATKKEKVGKKMPGEKNKVFQKELSDEDIEEIIE
jgi:protein CpxP